jgi:hypothetical protein
MIQHGQRLDRAPIRYDRPPDPALCLARLRRFAALSLAPGVCAVQPKARLARHATVSAFRDCLGLGLEAEARRELALALEAAIAA